jgi:hypothetical protein
MGEAKRKRFLRSGSEDKANLAERNLGWNQGAVKGKNWAAGSEIRGYFPSIKVGREREIFGWRAGVFTVWAIREMEGSGSGIVFVELFFRGGATGGT